MTANSVFNAYLDANIILILAAVLWAAAQFVMNRTRFRQTGVMHLRMIYGILLGVAASPFVIACHTMAIDQGVVQAGYAPSLSDYALSQFLNGRIEMAPSQFEALWMSRTVFTQNVTALTGPVGVAVAALMAVGLGACLYRLLRNTLRIRGLIRSGYVWRQIGRLTIVLTDRVDVPFSTRDLRRRYIVLPSTLLSQSGDLRIAVAHELQHMRQGDLEWEIVLEALRPVFFWNPAFHVLKRDVEVLREVACDQQVLLRGGFSVRAYCDCLLRVCHNATAPQISQRILVPSVPLVRADRGKRAVKTLRRRVLAMLANGQTAPSKWVMGVFAIPLVVLVGLGSVATQSSGDWSQDRLMLSAIVNLERLDQRTLATQN